MPVDETSKSNDLMHCKLLQKTGKPLCERFTLQEFESNLTDIRSFFIFIHKTILGPGQKKQKPKQKLVEKGFGIRKLIAHSLNKYGLFDFMYSLLFVTLKKHSLSISF